MKPSMQSLNDAAEEGVPFKLVIAITQRSSGEGAVGKEYYTKSEDYARIGTCNMLCLWLSEE
jgi:hypothetical protein